MRGLLFILFCFLPTKALIELDSNGYKGIILKIAENIPENPELLKKIKEWLTEASEKLYIATKNQLYLREITIQIPSTWTNNGQYLFVTDSSVKQVDIKISGENQQNPSTFGLTNCGKGGVFINFTPEVILKGNSGLFGNLGLVFVHEWGHFRWGLFDEYPSLPNPNKTEVLAHFYLRNGTYEPVRCTDEIKGIAIAIRNNEAYECKIGSDGLPEFDCEFFPFINNTGQKSHASIMGHSYVPSISYFCDNTPNNPSTNHNTDAKNFHNAVCGKRSSWEVMRLHEDFKVIRNPNADQNTLPKFNVVQAVPDRICLVFDVSGSMQNLINHTRTAAVSLIKYALPNNSWVGIVQFSTSATIVKGMSKLTTFNDRNSLISFLPSSTSGSTAIGLGLSKGLKALSALGATAGSIIYLLSDGEENVHPYIAEVLPTLVEKGVIVHTLAISGFADSKLANISLTTGGSSYFFSEAKANSTTLLDALSQPFLDSQTDPVIKILSEPISLAPNDVYATNFVIDGSIGRSTIIQFAASNVNDIQMSVASGDKDYTKKGSSADAGVVAIELPGIARNGTYTVTLASSNHVDGTLIVQSKSKNVGTEALQIKAWTKMVDMKYKVDVQFPVFVSILQGNAPVSNAEVKVLIENEDGKTSSLVLKDNAIGADILADDGIYSGYILSNLISKNGRHSLKITAEGVNSYVVVPRSRAPGIRGINEVKVKDPIGSFMRVTLAKKVIVSNYQPIDTSVDRIPPSPIKTLFLTKIFDYNKTYTITWIAVGDDFDTGRAFRYDLRVSENSSQLTNHPDQAESLGIDLKPGEPGNIEMFTFTLATAHEMTTHYIGIRAVDESNNTGGISNTISVSVLRVDSPWRTITPDPTEMYEGSENKTSSENKTIILYGIIPGLAVLLIVFVVLTYICLRKRKEKSYMVSF